MKNLSFCLMAFIAFTCVQTIHASSCSCGNTCEEDFKELRDEAIKFFDTFGAEHDIAHQDVEAIGNVVGLLGSALDSFASGNLGADLEIGTLQCILKNFIENFNQLYPPTVNNINHLDVEIDKLLRMASKFQYSHDLYCSRRELTGCEAKLNKLTCELGVFFKLIRENGRQAKSIVRGLKNAATALNRVIRNFSNKYKLTCGSDQPPMPNSGTLKRDVKNTYFPQMKKASDAAAKEISDIAGICGRLIPTIDDWKY